MTARPSARYSALSTEDGEATRRPSYVAPASAGLSWDDQGPAARDKRYSYELRDRVPWRSVLLAAGLLLLGVLLLTISYLISTKHMGGDKSQSLGFLALGALAFLPGFYELRIAYYAWRGREGYSFSHIPTY
eukprot:SM000212S06906  [mRNA]  locus=s212:109246:109742:+ [translate_table: standard]